MPRPDEQLARGKANEQRDALPLPAAVPPILVFIASFLPRVLGYVGSTDIWGSRARAFTEALAHGDWATTLQAPHPGVTTMWLAGLARWVGLAFEPRFDHLRLSRQLAIELIPIALTVSLGIVLAYALLARLFGRPSALLAALLLALDPYHISLSKAVHVDALVSVFCLLSALYAWGYLSSPTWHRMLLSGIFGALAVLTKTPGIFMVPYTGLCLLSWGWRRWRALGQEKPHATAWQRVGPIVRQIGSAALIWALAFAGTYVLLWPSMWVQPVTTLGLTYGGSRYYLRTPHENPVYFLGQSTSEDPGPLFYPLTMPLKTTAVTLTGFLLCLGIGFRRRFRPPVRLFVVLGLGFILLFVAQMTLGEKKFTRYALPALQFVILLAALGWAHILRQALQNRPRLLNLALLALVAVQFAVSVPRHPYYGTHYNYALGGPKVILESQIVPGQEKGEGLEIAADYLNSLPLSKLLVVGAEPFTGFYHYFQGKTVPLTDDRVDYMLLTRSALLRRVRANNWEHVWQAYRTRKPKLVVAFDGVPYVWVYKVGSVIQEADLAHPVAAKFGSSIQLLGYDYHPQQVRPGETLELTLYWEALIPPDGDYTVFAHLLDPSDQIRGQKDNPPQGGMYPTYLWDAGEQIRDTYALPIDPGAPPGTYQLAVGMYILNTMERLPIVTQSSGSTHPAIPTPDQRLLLPGPQVLPP